MSAAGVTTVRLFPEWRDFEPTKGTWKWERGDALVEAASKNDIEINAILMGSPPGEKKAHAFPMDDLDGWSNYVSAVVGRYKKRIHYWEVWNEGNGGFNDGKHTTTDYAKLAIATYTAAKKADPHAKIGLTVASFDVLLSQPGHPGDGERGQAELLRLSLHPPLRDRRSSGRGRRRDSILVDDATVA